MIDKGNMIVQFIYARRVWSRTSMKQLARSTHRTLSNLNRRLSMPMKLSLGECLLMLDEMDVGRGGKKEFFDVVIKQWEKDKAENGQSTDRD